MSLEQLKDLVNKTEFSPEAKKMMSEILDGAIKRGSLTAEEKKRLTDIVDLEIEKAHMEADAMEEAALTLEAFNAEVVQAAEIAADEIKAISKDLEKT